MKKTYNFKVSNKRTAKNIKKAVQKIVQDKIHQIKDEIKSIEKIDMDVGILNDGSVYPHGVSVVDVACIYELGASDRPFLRPTYRSNEASWRRYFSKIFKSSMSKSNNLSDICTNSMDRTGVLMVKDISWRIKDIELFSTGRLHDTLSYAVMDNGKVVSSSSTGMAEYKKKLIKAERKMLRMSKNK